VPLPSNNPELVAKTSSGAYRLMGPPEPWALFARSKGGLNPCETFNTVGVRGSRMGALVKEFEQYKRLYLRYKHQYSKDSNRRRENKVRTFLRFCEGLGVRRIKDIKEEHYRRFVSEFLSSRAAETKRKYLLALKEFFERAHLPIKVNPSKNVRRTKEKKLLRILGVLGIDIRSLEHEKIQEILKIL